MNCNSRLKKAGRFALAGFLAIAIGFSPACAFNAKAASDQDVESQASSWRYSGGEIIAEDDYAAEEDHNAQMGQQAEDLSEAEQQAEDLSEAEQQDEEMGVQSEELQAAQTGYAKGIDVSYWQHSINWSKVKADGIQFAILRCGYGSNTSSKDDSTFRRNASECARLGIPYGVYLYSYANSVAEAKDEAEHALRMLDGYHPDLPVYYDLEDREVAKASNSTIQAMGRTFCSMLTTEGYRAGVYASLSWWNNKLGSGLDSYDKWVAQWNSSCDYKKSYRLWQYSSNLSVNGISGRVDGNWLMVPWSSMKDYMAGAYTVPGGNVQDIDDFTGYLNRDVTSRKGPGRGYYSSDAFRNEEKITVTRQYGNYYEITNEESADAGSGCWVSKGSISLPTDPNKFGPDPNFVPDPDDPDKVAATVLLAFDGSIIKDSRFTNVRGSIYYIDENGYALKG